MSAVLVNIGSEIDIQSAKIGLMPAPLLGQIRGRRLAELLGPMSGAERPSSSGLRDAVRHLVLDGRLPPGTRLPAERELAEAIGVSRTLVARALDRLREDGLVASRRGAGSWVTLPDGKSEVASYGGWFPPTGEILNLAQATPAAPPELCAALDRIRPRFAEQLHGHGYQLHGLLPLRERIAERFTERGLPTTPEQVLVTNGAQHGFALTLRLFVSPGERVLIEHPTYPNALEAIRAVNAVPAAVPMTESGWDAEAVEAVLHQASPRLAYLLPDFQNPTGFRMGTEQRARLAMALRRTRTLTVVDETLVDMDLSGETAPPSMASFAADHVIVIGSASKSFWGGLRLGWIRAPEEVVQRMVLGRAGVDLGSPVLEQLVLTELLANAEPVLSRRRAEFIECRDSLIAALGQHCPQWHFRVPEGGLALWCDLGSPVSSRLAVIAERHGVRMAPGARFAVNGSLERYARLPYTLPIDRMREAVRRLAHAWAAVDRMEGWTNSVLEAPVT
jgi:DNA-binding transcriptional MocR family regulator